MEPGFASLATGLTATGLSATGRHCRQRFCRWNHVLQLLAPASQLRAKRRRFSLLPCCASQLSRPRPVAVRPVASDSEASHFSSAARPASLLSLRDLLPSGLLRAKRSRFSAFISAKRSAVREPQRCERRIGVRTWPSLSPAIVVQSCSTGMLMDHRARRNDA